MIALTLVTSFGALGALAQNLGLFVVLGTLAAGSALTAAGFYAGSLGTVQPGGWLFVVSAAAARLVAGAMVLEHSFGRTIVPLGKWTKAGNVPGARATDPSPTRRGCPASASASNRTAVTRMATFRRLGAFADQDPPGKDLPWRVLRRWPHRRGFRGGRRWGQAAGFIYRDTR